MIHGLAPQHGYARTDSKPGQGATFKLYQPRNEGEGQERDQPAALIQPKGAPGGESVLVVEGEPVEQPRHARGASSNGLGG